MSHQITKKLFCNECRRYINDNECLFDHLGSSEHRVSINKNNIDPKLRAVNILVNSKEGKSDDSSCNLI